MKCPVTDCNASIALISILYIIAVVIKDDLILITTVIHHPVGSIVSGMLYNMAD